MPPVAASVFFTFLYSVFSTVEFYYEKTEEIMYASVGAAILNVALNGIFIRIFGYIAAGYTTLACYLFLSMAHYQVMKKTIPENIGHIELFDMKLIATMAFVMIASTVLFSALYSFTLIRYSLIVIFAVVGIIKRKDMISILKTIKVK